MRASILVCLLLCIGATAIGQPVPGSRPAGLSDVVERRAASQAFAELMSRLLALPMADRQTLGQWIGGRAQVEMALRQTAYEQREVKVVSPPGAKTCRAEVSVPLAEVARGWARRLRQENAASIAELEAIREWSLRAGQGRLVAIGLAERAAGGEGTGDVPGWEHLPVEAKELARQAAVADAVEQILGNCRAMRLAGRGPLADVFDVYVPLEEAFARHLERDLPGEVIFEPFGVCRYVVRLPHAEAVDRLARAEEDVVVRSSVPRMGLARSLVADPSAVMMVEGLGISPPVRVAWPGAVAVVEAPAWANEMLTAVGQGEPPRAETDPARRRAVAVERARLDAIRTMWFQVDELVLADGRSVRHLIRAHPEIAADLRTIERRMQPVGEVQFDDEGRATVKVTMPLAPLWDVLARVADAPAPPCPVPTTTRSAKSE